MNRLFALFALPILLTSCSVLQEEQEKYTVAFSQCIGSDAWRRQMYSEIELELSFHPEIEFIYTQADGISEIQVAQIDSLVKLKPDVLIVSPNEAAPLTEVIDEAYQKGIPVILIDRKTLSDGYTAFVGANNYEVGFRAAQKALSILGDKGNIIEISGLKASTPAIERHLGFFDGIKDVSSITLDTTIYGDWLQDSASKALHKLSPNSKDVNLVFAHNDVMARAAYEYFKDSPEVKIIGVDGLVGDDLGIDMVLHDKIDATVAYPTGGKEAIRAAALILNGQNVPKNIGLSSTVIDYNNASIMRQQEETIIEQRKTASDLNEKISEQLRVYHSQQNSLVILVICALILSGILLYMFKLNQTISKQQRHISEQNKILEQLNATKDKFFSVVAHDLKSPLNSLKLFSAFIIKNFDRLEREKILDKMTHLNESVTNTLKLSDNLIKWAQLQMNDIETNRSTFLLKEVTDRIDEVYHEIAKEKEIEIKIDVSERISVFGDQNQIEYIIRNLVNNAIKFTKPKGEILVHADQTDNQRVRIKIQDNGIGMHDRVKTKLLNLHKVSSQTGTAGEKGTGLGLILAFEFAKLNQGEINIDSVVGEGTTVTLSLTTGA